MQSRKIGVFGGAKFISREDRLFTDLILMEVPPCRVIVQGLAILAVDLLDLSADQA